MIVPKVDFLDFYSLFKQLNSQIVMVKIRLKFEPEVYSRVIKHVMIIKMEIQDWLNKDFGKGRREFIKKGMVLAGLSGLSGYNYQDEEEEVTPSEDLMREHGLLNRILLIYDYCRIKLVNKEDFQVEALYSSAQIIRNFIEDYHEKLEENFLFPRFEKANQLTELVHILKEQHKAGRILTEHILQHKKQSTLGNSDENQKLAKLLADFNAMYRPHEAREDTVLFPALRKIVSKNEYYALGEDFEKKEHELFGRDGFDKTVDRVAEIEKKIGIYDLSRFTPVP